MARHYASAKDAAEGGSDQLVAAALTAYTQGRFSPKLIKAEKLEVGTDIIEDDEDARRLDWMRATVLREACEGQSRTKGELTEEERRLQKEAQMNMSGDEVQFRAEAKLDRSSTSGLMITGPASRSISTEFTQGSSGTSTIKLITTWTTLLPRSSMVTSSIFISGSRVVKGHFRKQSEIFLKVLTLLTVIKISWDTLNHLKAIVQYCNVHKRFFLILIVVHSFWSQQYICKVIFCF